MVDISHKIIHVQDPSSGEVVNAPESCHSLDVAVLFEVRQLVAARLLSPHSRDKFRPVQMSAKLLHYGEAAFDFLIGLCDVDRRMGHGGLL